jgi:hypothetical protein
MKYIAFPIDEIDIVMEICVGEVSRYTDIEKSDHPNKIGIQITKAKWEGKVEALQEMLKFGTECNEIK